MGPIRFEQSPAALLSHVVVAEIEAAGHTVTDSGQVPQIAVTVREFTAHTDTTPLYWDVIGDLVVSLEVSSAPTPTAPLEYRARCADRTYVWPSEKVIAGVMSKCINEFGSNLRNDGRVADALRSAARH